jgi:3-oxoacyl-[acyl-carrier protein] reductase
MICFTLIFEIYRVMLLLKDRVSIITGGSRGIGSALVKKFIEHGSHVIFTYRSSEDQARKLEESLRGEGQIQGIRSDATSAQDVESLIKSVIDSHSRIDILVNNAGITDDTLMLRMTEEQWDRVIQTNLRSVFLMTRQVLKTMIRQRHGSIINLSSVVGISGNAGQANYAASKAAIIGFTKSIAKEVGSRNIRCNAIAPGFIETDMTDKLDEKTQQNYLQNIPLRRFGRAEEVAELAAFLGSDLSAYVTGQVLSICGGLNM